MRLTKHQGLGNDFLVWLDIDGVAAGADALVELARAACERHRGVGADGLLHVTTGGPAHVTMALFNADGSRAEMSGNGIACLAQAVVIAGVAGPDRISVATDAGLRTVEVAAESARRHRMRVDMGPATIGGPLDVWIDGDVLDATRVDVGNPHVVLRVEEPDKFPIEDVGERICAATVGGVNVEAVAPAVDGTLRMVVYERGVGLTEACGTGACAAAAAADEWGLVDDRVVVAMPGGSTEVEVGPTVFLTTPVVHVATIDFHWP